MTHVLASEGGYQAFHLGGTEWFWLIFSAGTAIVALMLFVAAVAATIGYFAGRGPATTPVQRVMEPRISQNLVLWPTVFARLAAILATLADVSVIVGCGPEPLDCVRAE